MCLPYAGIPLRNPQRCCCQAGVRYFSRVTVIRSLAHSTLITEKIASYIFTHRNGRRRILAWPALSHSFPCKHSLEQNGHRCSWQFFVFMEIRTQGSFQEWGTDWYLFISIKSNKNTFLIEREKSFYFRWVLYWTQNWETLLTGNPVNVRTQTLDSTLCCWNWLLSHKKWKNTIVLGDGYSVSILYVCVPMLDQIKIFVLTKKLTIIQTELTSSTEASPPISSTNQQKRTEILLSKNVCFVTSLNIHKNKLSYWDTVINKLLSLLVVHKQLRTGFQKIWRACGILMRHKCLW